MHSIFCSSYLSVRLLSEVGSDVDARNESGETPLLLAARRCGCGGRRCVSTLLELGADPWAEGGSGRYFSLHYMCADDDYLSVVKKILKKDPEKTEELLSSAPSDCDASIAHFAAQGRGGILKHLLKLEPSLFDARTKKSCTGESGPARERRQYD